MKIFAELHHQALFRSLQYLFEERLGWELFRPVGLDWFTEGYWKLAQDYGDSPATVNQYLQIRESEFHLNDVIGKGQFYEIADSFAGKPHRAITLEQFKEMEFDIIVASHPYHVEPYRRLIQNYQPGAKLILQMGNEWRPDFSLVKNLMASTKPFGVPPDVNAVFYHQEFDTKLYSPSDKPPKPVCRSFVNTLAIADLFVDDWRLFQEMEKANPQFKWESYGAGCRDGNVSGQKEVARLMKESAYGVMLKKNGDGFGHVLYSFASCGVPILFRGHQYRDKLGGELLEHGVTGIDVEVSRDIPPLDSEWYNSMQRHVRERFHALIDFDREFLQIKDFLGRLR